MRETDYYSILGLESHATLADIRRSYRTLAMRFHPDQNPDDPTAEERFKQITQAYKVLIDPKKRASYDRSRGGGVPASQGLYGFRGQPAANHRPAPSPPPQPQAPPKPRPWWEEEQPKEPPRPEGTQYVPSLDFEVDMSVPSEVAAAGGKQPFAVTINRACPTCNGTGAKPGTTTRRCPECDPDNPSPTCRLCGGRGYLVSQCCPDCMGRGRERITKTITVPIPPRSKAGQKIVIPGEGLAGKEEGQVGDLVVKLHVREGAPELERRGNDVYSEIEVTPSVSAQGGRVRIRTVDSTFDLLIPPGTRPGTVMRLEKMGPRIRGTERGDHYVTVKIIAL